MRWLVIALCLAGSAAAEASPKKVVVVELFTSQGCSSCPPADRLLGRLDSLEQDVEVIALAFHVDYWNYIGWSDPFSSAEWSGRQRAYGRRLGAGRIYTPQLVVNGTRHAVGSNRRAVMAALKGARGLVPLEARIVTRRSRSFTVRAKAPPRARLLLIVYESGLATRVPRGENAGRKLRNDQVVRAVTPFESGVARLALQPGWKRDQLGAVVIAQNPETLAIVGARRLGL